MLILAVFFNRLSFKQQEQSQVPLQGSRTWSKCNNYKYLQITRTFKNDRENLVSRIIDCRGIDVNARKP